MKNPKAEGIGTGQVKSSPEPSSEIQTKCKHCGYKWLCNSKLQLVSCPSCMKKTEVKK